MNDEYIACPNCTGQLRYLINRDAYCCGTCRKEYDTISVERSHRLYDGGPPKEIDRREDRL